MTWNSRAGWARILVVLFVASSLAPLALGTLAAAPAPASPGVSRSPLAVARAILRGPSPSSYVPSPAPAAAALAPAPSAAPAPRLQADSIVVAPGWDALHYGNNGGSSDPWAPPDVQIATGPNHVVEMVNLLMAVYTKQGSLLRITDLATFFGSGTDFVSDPKIQYDSVSGRWFATLTDVATSAGSATGQVLLAVSTSSDPTGTWRHWGVPATDTGQCLDQPILGIGTTIVVVSVNVFSSCISTTFTYVGAQYWILSKADLVSGAAAPATYASSPDVNEGSIHPVQLRGASPVNFMVSTYWPGTATTSNTLHLFTITGTPPGSVTVTVTSLSMPTAAIPPGAPQNSTKGPFVDTGDIRISDAVWSNGTLWLGFDEACLSNSRRACIRLVQIHTDTVTIAQDFDIDLAGAFVYYPGIMTDVHGNLVVVMTYSSTSAFPGVMVTGRLVGDPVNTYVTPIVVRPGDGAENLGSPICTTGNPSVCRWGDYLAAVLDPSDPTLVWIGGEYGVGPGWGTHIASAGVKALLQFAAVINGGGSGYSAPLLSYVFGGSPSTASLNPSASVIADPGTPWSVTATLGGSTSTERWQVGSVLGPGTTSGVVNASFSATAEYYHQYSADFGAVLAGTPPVPPTVAAIQFGQQASVATNTPTWVDAGSAYAYANPLGPASASERWYTHDPLTGTASGPLTPSVAYYHQYNVSFGFTVTGAVPYMGVGPTASIRSFGTNADLAVPATLWVDAGGAYSYPASLPGSNDTIRWSAGTNGVGTVSDASPISVEYHAQYAVVVQTHPAAASGMISGAGWYDPGSTATVQATSNGDWGFQGWTGAYAGMSSSLSLAVNGPIVIGATFYPGLTIVAGSGGSVSYAYGGTTGTVPAGVSATIYVAPGTQVTLTASPGTANAFGGWSGLASGPSTTVTVTVMSPGTATATFSLSVLLVVGVPLAIVLVVALLVLLLVFRRRRRREPPVPR